MTINEELILVNESDEILGFCEKLKAHELGLCHRAFSIFIFKNTGNGTELLIQKRANEKYHCPKLWSNTCCSHPRPHEDTKDAANRRLGEELGFKTDLQHVGAFHYTAHFDNGLIENEYDHVFIGIIDQQEITINPAEVSSIQWITTDNLKKAIIEAPEHFTPWLLKSLEIATKAAHTGKH